MAIYRHRFLKRHFAASFKNGKRRDAHVLMAEGDRPLFAVSRIKSDTSSAQTLDIADPAQFYQQTVQLGYLDDRRGRLATRVVIVVGLPQNVDGTRLFEIQTDARAGDVGGPVLTHDGQLLGMVVPSPDSAVTNADTRYAVTAAELAEEVTDVLGLPES